MALAVFSPISHLYPFTRKGGIGPTVVVPMESGTDIRRLKRQTSPVELMIRLGGKKTNVETDFAFIEVKGGHTPFKFKDPWHYSITAEAVGTGNDSRTVWYLDYKYIDSSNITVKLNGTPTSAYTLDDEKGKITFDVAPGSGVSITADYQFYRKFYFEMTNPRDCRIENPTYGFWTLDVTMRESLV